MAYGKGVDTETIVNELTESVEMVELWRKWVNFGEYGSAVASHIHEEMKIC